MATKTATKISQTLNPWASPPATARHLLTLSSSSNFSLDRKQQPKESSEARLQLFWGVPTVPRQRDWPRTWCHVSSESLSLDAVCPFGEVTKLPRPTMSVFTEHGVHKATYSLTAAFFVLSYNVVFRVLRRRLLAQNVSKRAEDPKCLSFVTNCSLQSGLIHKKVDFQVLHTSISCILKMKIR